DAALHFLVAGENGFFGDIVRLAFEAGGAFFVFAADDGEGVEDVGGVLLVQAVEVEEGRVEFAAELEAAVLGPDEGRAKPAAVARKRLQVPRGVGQFEYPRHQPVAERKGELRLESGIPRPLARHDVTPRGKNRKLPQNEAA